MISLGKICELLIIRCLVSRVLMRSLFVLCFLIACSWAHAQEHVISPNTTEPSHKKLFSKIEILGGLSYIRPRGNDFFTDILDNKFGINAGLGLSHELSFRFGVDIKFLYEEKGYRFKVYQQNYDYNPPATQKSVSDLTLRYATCSISPRYAIDKRRRFYVSAGPYIGYLIDESHWNEIYIDGKLISKTGARGYKSSSYETLDFGIVSSLGYNLSIKSFLTRTIQLNYNLGLIDVSKPPTGPMWNNTYSLLIGITIKK